MGSFTLYVVSLSDPPRLTEIGCYEVPADPRARLNLETEVRSVATDGTHLCVAGGKQIAILRVAS